MDLIIHSSFSNVDVNVLLVFAYGIFVGCLTGMLGAGGGTLIVPFLALYLKLPIKTAIGTSLFQVTGIAASGAFQHYRYGSSDLKLALILIISGSSMAFMGARFAQLVPNNILKAIFGVFVIMIALKFVRSKSGEPISETIAKNETSSDRSSHIKQTLHHLAKFLPVGMITPIPLRIHRKTKIAEYTINLLMVFLLGGAVGFSSGLLGVGGGFLLVPGLVFLGIPMKVAVGTDLTQIIASASVGTATYFLGGYVDPIIGTLLMAGGIIGTVIGTRLNKRTPTSTLKKIFGVLMVFVGLLMVRNALMGTSGLHMG
jgi:hypothetical protein